MQSARDLSSHFRLHNQPTPTNLISEHTVTGNSKGKAIYERLPYGGKYWYNSNNVLTHYKGLDGYEAWYEHDSDGKLTYIKDNEGNEERFNLYRNVVYKKYPNGFKKWFDSEGKLTQVKAPKELMMKIWEDGSQFGYASCVNPGFREVAMKFANAVLTEIQLQSY